MNLIEKQYQKSNFVFFTNPIAPVAKIFLTTLLILPIILTRVSIAENSKYSPEQRIIAVVNNEIISQVDFSDRIKFVIFSSRLPDNVKTVKRISPQILRVMINDKLKLQETRKLGIKVSQKELQAAIGELEKNNGLPKGRMRILLKSNGISFRSFEQQVHSQIAWRKAVIRQVLSKSKIGEGSVDMAIKKIEANKGKPEYRVAEIFIPFEPNKSQGETFKNAMRLYFQIQRGANFSALARAFSQSASAANGGNLGWIRPEQIERGLSDIMIKMEEKTSSKPQKGAGGYYILKLLKKRMSPGLPTEKIQATLQQLFLPMQPNTSAKELAIQANKISSKTKSCSELNRKGKELGSRNSGSVEVKDISRLPKKIREIAQNIKLSKASDPIQTKSGLLILMVCKRNDGSGTKFVRRTIKNMLLEKRAVLMGRTMLRNIQRAAFLDIRR